MNLNSSLNGKVGEKFEAVQPSLDRRAAMPALLEIQNTYLCPANATAILTYFPFSFFLISSLDG